MPTLAIRILVVGGVANLVLSFVLGWVLASINAVLNTAGLGIVAYGVVRGVF